LIKEIIFRTCEWNGEEHPDTLTAANNLAAAYTSEGKFPHAEALVAQVLEVRKRVLGAEHPSTPGPRGTSIAIAIVAGWPLAS
jgi:hypothetical protein